MTPTASFVLPQSPAAPPVRLDLSPFPIVVAYDRADRWSITEVIGGARVQHGHLRVVDGGYAISTASGLETAALSWRAAVHQHIHRKR